MHPSKATGTRDLLQNIAWEDLTVLLAAVEEGSLSGAARSLRVSQSTASRRLARLEEALNARLFDRTPEGLVATDLTDQLLPHVRLVEGHMADLVRVAAGQEATPTGRVRLALPDGLASNWLLPRLPDFHDRFPEVELDLTIGPAVVDLVRGESEIALRFVPSSAPDLIELPLGSLPLAAYARRDLADQPLDATRWVMLLDPNRAFHETHWIEDHIRPRRRTTVSLWNALFAAIEAGVGAGILPQRVAERAGLVRLGPHLPPLEARRLRLVFHRALRQVPRIRAVVDWVRHEATLFLGESTPSTRGEARDR